MSNHISGSKFQDQTSTSFLHASIFSDDVDWVAKWVLICEENGMLQTGSSGEIRNWITPILQLVKQYLGILEGKGSEIVGTSSV